MAVSYKRSFLSFFGVGEVLKFSVVTYSLSERRTKSSLLIIRQRESTQDQPIHLRLRESRATRKEAFFTRSKGPRSFKREDPQSRAALMSVKKRIVREVVLRDTLTLNFLRSDKREKMVEREVFRSLLIVLDHQQAAMRR